jgi:hypothetical protein
MDSGVFARYFLPFADVAFGAFDSPPIKLFPELSARAQRAFS